MYKTFFKISCKPYRIEVNTITKIQLTDANQVVLFAYSFVRVFKFLQRHVLSGT